MKQKILMALTGLAGVGIGFSCAGEAPADEMEMAQAQVGTTTQGIDGLTCEAVPGSQFTNELCNAWCNHNPRPVGLNCDDDDIGPCDCSVGLPDEGPECTTWISTFNSAYNSFCQTSCSTDSPSGNPDAPMCQGFCVPNCNVNPPACVSRTGFDIDFGAATQDFCISTLYGGGQDCCGGGMGCNNAVGVDIQVDEVVGDMVASVNSLNDPMGLLNSTANFMTLDGDCTFDDMVEVTASCPQGNPGCSFMISAQGPGMMDSPIYSPPTDPAEETFQFVHGGSYSNIVFSTNSTVLIDDITMD